MAPSPDNPLRVGTRGSPLALAQANMVAAAIRAIHDLPDEAVRIVPITTTGDVVQDRPLAEIGGKALWTKELDRCLMDGRTDLSVHSMKDVETIRPEAMRIAAMLPRADVCDRLIGAQSIAALREAAVVGTSSPRRKAQLLSRRPDLQIVSIRGNVQTRLRKLEEGEVDATLLAAAGLKRLGMLDIGELIGDMLPAPAQGAVGIEIRSDDPVTAAIVEPIDHADTSRCVRAERRFLARLDGNCRSPVAALATCEGVEIKLRAEILTPDGRECRSGSTSFAFDNEPAPARLAEQLLGEASAELRALFGIDA